MTDRPNPPARRAYQVYLYAVCLATVIVLVFATAQALYGVVRIVAPETTARSAPSTTPTLPIGTVDFGSTDPNTERDRGTAQLIENGILALVAGGVFALHWGWARRAREEQEAAADVPPSTEPARPAAPRRRGEEPPRRRPPAR